jgi:NDP-4-keto-2,6-dideoxyhexose 3-C-methyltransferase
VKSITQCRSCKGEVLHEFLNLGNQYLSDFREDNSKPPQYPLVAVLCDRCKLVQLKHTTPQVEMYHDRYGFKSGVNEKIREDLDSIVLHGFQYVNDPTNWLDTGSNDGTLLSFVPENVYRVGVDPVKFLCAEAEQHADLIINDYFNDTVGGEFDVITTVSCFYDMPEPTTFVRDIKSVLAPKGVWIIQQNYLLTTLQLSAVDNFVHEHLEYYTLKSLEHLLDRFDLQVVEVTTSMINGGSIRTVVAHKDAFQVDESVGKQRHIEYIYGVEMLVTYQMFAEDIGVELNKLRQLVTHLKAQDRSVAILAASTRGATIWQSAELDHELIDYAVERNMTKVGKQFSAIGVPIISEGKFRELKPDFCIMGPWWFYEQILVREKEYIKSGGNVIIPLPEVRVVNAQNLSDFLPDVQATS